MVPNGAAVAVITAHDRVAHANKGEVRKVLEPKIMNLLHLARYPQEVVLCLPPLRRGQRRVT